MIDEAVFNNLLAMERAGRRNAVQNILALYLSNSSRLIQEIREAIHTGDAAMLKARGHQLKSASVQVGAMDVSFHAGEIERLAQANQLAFAADLLTPLEESVNTACRMFKDKIRSRAA